LLNVLRDFLSYKKLDVCFHFFILLLAADFLRKRSRKITHRRTKQDQSDLTDREHQSRSYRGTEEKVA